MYFENWRCKDFWLCHQEKLVQEVMARQMPQPKLANTLSGALYPGFAMPIYAPSAAAMAPIMHVIPPQQMAPQSPVRSEDTQPSSYVQQLQSKWENPQTNWHFKII